MRRDRGRIVAAALLSATAMTVLSGAGCSHDWEAFDPRLAVSAASASASGGGGEPTTGPGPGAGGNGAGPGAGGGGAGAGGTGVVEDCATPADDDGNGKANDHCAIWSERFGDALNQDGVALAIDPAGDILVAGRMNGSADFGGGTLTSAGKNDIFIAKFTTEGTHVWSRIFGGVLDDGANAIAADSTGNVVVTGAFEGTLALGAAPTQIHVSNGALDVFVVELDPDGNYLWSKSFGGTLADTGRAVTVDSGDNVVVAGDFADSIDLGAGVTASAGALDGFVVELDPLGAAVWSKTFGDTGDDSVGGVARIPQDGVALTGYFAGTVTLGGPALTAGPNDGTEGFVAQVDKAGQHVWSAAFGKDATLLSQRGQFIRVDSGGDLLVAGTFQGMVDLGGGPIDGQGMDDLFVAKYSAAGDHVWSKGFGNAQNEALAGLAVDGAGAVLLTGTLRGGTVDLGGGPLTVAEPDDMFVLKLDGTGKHLWSRRFGITGDQDGGGIVTNLDNEVIVTGFIEGTTDFGNGVLTTGGADDVLLAKLPP